MFPAWLPQVEAKYANLGCYYLDENLNNFTDTWKAQHTVSKRCSNDLPQALPEALDHHDGKKNRLIPFLLLELNGNAMNEINRMLYLWVLVIFGPYST